MVKSFESFLGNGIKDWLVQRISAIFMLTYFLFFLIFFLENHSISYKIWSKFFENFWIKIFTFATFLNMSMHICIGMYIVLCDYINNHILRLALQYIVLSLCIFYTIWIFYILWN